jgi:microcystin-dependent protein
MQDPFLGAIAFYPYDFAPKGWASCEGQLVSIAQFSALFSLLGTNFGGNGTSTFGLPDLRGRVPVGFGQMPGGEDYIIGEIAGAENVTINITDMAAHTHSLGATTLAGTVNTPFNQILAAPFVGNRQSGISTGQPYNPGTPNTTLVPQSLTLSGNNLPHNNVQPYLVVRPCIAMVGIFPSRN